MQFSGHSVCAVDCLVLLAVFTCRFISLMRSFLAHSSASSSLVSTLVWDTYIPVSDIFLCRDLDMWPTALWGSSGAFTDSRSRLFIPAFWAAAVKSVRAPSVSSFVSPKQRTKRELYFWYHFKNELDFSHSFDHLKTKKKQHYLKRKKTSLVNSIKGSQKQSDPYTSTGNTYT